MQIRALTPRIGAEVTGIDLRAPLSPETCERLHHAFLQHIVLVVRDQVLTPQQFRDGMRNFGEPMRQHRARYNLPECPDVSIVTNQGGFGRAEMWHTDHTNHERPPKITALHGVVLPSQGGATWFASMYDGLAALTAEQRERVRGLVTVNDMEDNSSYSAEDRARHPGAVRHPMVRTHPETGREALYFHLTKSKRIDGMADAEVRPFLEALLARAVQPEWTYAHRWRAGDVVMLDNRCALHRAEHDYPPGEHRLLWRVILRGDRPFGAALPP
ncbi:MAG: TauD/TfdA family dioxygenase [Ectothiorhodospiraceae bacterium]|nr:TauD/TfdA family dioxygenase [Chromatiales bacterium]MCP5154846.1 TauD/TfdA family dioxygenase [Ectothiorhodospiraceae bacterium]